MRLIHASVLSPLLVLAVACSGGGSKPAETPKPSIAAFRASKTLIQKNEPTTLSATYADGTGVVDQGVGALASGAPLNVRPQATTTYTLTVTNAKGETAKAQAVVTVQAVDATVTAPPTLPIGQVGTASVPQLEGATYVWSVTHGAVKTGQGTSGITFTVDGGADASVACTVTNSFGSSASGSATVVPTAALPRSLAYADPSGGTGGFRLLRNASLSTPTHLVLDLYGPSGTNGFGAGIRVSVDTANALWDVVDPAATTPAYGANGSVLDLGSGTPLLAATVKGDTLSVAVAQKGTASPKALGSGPLLRIALKPKADGPAAVGSAIGLRAVGSALATVVDGAGGRVRSNLSLAVGTLTVN